MNTTIATLLDQKGAGAIFTVPTTVTVAEAVQAMNTHKVGSVLVMNGLRLAGIFTERDVLRRVVCADVDPRFTPITKVMTTDIITVERSTTVQQVMDTFTEKRCRHLPVVENGQVVGVISIGDVSRWVANLERAEAESLRQYIAGGLSM
jgi:CBS domain-containing protein